MSSETIGLILLLIAFWLSPEIVITMVVMNLIVGVCGLSIGVVGFGGYWLVDWIWHNISFWEGVNFILIVLGCWLLSIIYMISLYVVPDLMSALMKRIKTAYTNKFKKKPSK